MNCFSQRKITIDISGSDETSPEEVKQRRDQRTFGVVGARMNGSPLRNKK